MSVLATYMQLPLIPASLAEQAENYARSSKALATKTAYSADWRHFTSWCERHQVDPLPAAAATIVLYITDLANHYKVSTITRRMSAISQAHKVAGFTPPIRDGKVYLVMAGIRRTRGVSQKRAAPILLEDLKAMLATLDDSTQGLRDRAILLLGWSAGLRRSEIVGLNLADVEFRRRGLVITLRKSKTNQEGKPERVGVPFGRHDDTCAVRAVQAWLQAADIHDGPLFRAVGKRGEIGDGRLSTIAVNRLVKRAAQRVGLDSERYSAHSLRAGLVTSARAVNAPDPTIQRQTRHKSRSMLDRYDRPEEEFENNVLNYVDV